MKFVWRLAFARAVEKLRERVEPQGVVIVTLDGKAYPIRVPKVPPSPNGRAVRLMAHRLRNRLPDWEIDVDGNHMHFRYVGE